MRTRSIRLITSLGALSVAGVLLIQFLWIRQAYIAESRTFDHNLHLALRNVVESLCQTDGLDVPAYNPIEQISANYYIVRTSQVLQPQTLEYFLTAELNKRNIFTDFEYGIYDCQSQLMVYGNQVSENKGKLVKASFPSLKEDQYYFGVLFPSRQGYLLGRMDFLVYSSGGLLLVIGFFAYAMVVMARQKRLSEIQRDFINNMTHEFKTPLSTIKLSAEVIRSANEKDSKERLHKYASLIEKEADRLQSHVEEVLQIALVEKNKLQLHMQLQSVADLLEEFDQTAREKVQVAGGKWQLECHCKGSKIKTDTLHFQNVLGNLLDNSIKYSEGAPVISLDVTDTGHEVLLTFKDEGRGIPAQSLKHVFKKFYRVPSGDVQDVSGFGLGLFYVKQIVKAHNGDITVSSTPGRGTTFRIKIPVVHEK
ncbi:HAMP domain-containing sensor histidine kinase [uncultured Imperialibacter sp.]|uniref:sensor histidine kinase n=1 Tax=uncultured Imperialibacter sp. TaxID=1672639 RepID=UPI0030DAF18A|tara:strand:- start:3331 stop:4599 length:1269 start_codon:yes stop_codon:yes gene_type:complete